MLQSDPGDFNPLSAVSVESKPSYAQLIQSIAQKSMTGLSLLAVLSLAGFSWLTTTAIAPQIVQAYTANIEVSLSRQSPESFQSFLRRAEAVARAAVQRSFDRDILVSDVDVTVVGQNNGAIVPVLKLNVTRKAWRSRPDPQRWITYLPNSDLLLGFNQPTGQPEVPEPAPTPTQQPTQNPYRRQRPSRRQPPQTIINIPGANIRLVPPPPQPTTLPPGAAGTTPPGGTGTTPSEGTGTTPSEGTGTTPPGGTGNTPAPAPSNQPANNGTNTP
jgi:hypothetical protein